MRRRSLVLIIGLLSSALYAQNHQMEAHDLDSISAKLETLFMETQLFRRLYQDAEEKLGDSSPEMDYFWEVV